MSQIAGTDLIVLERGLRTTFFLAYEGRIEDWQQFCTIQPSTSPSEKYGWLGSPPHMREFTDERVPKGLSEFSYTIYDKRWENTIAVGRTELEDDQYGQIRIRTQEMATLAGDHRIELVASMIVSGTSELCYDGQYFFDNDHSEGDSGTQDNLLAGTGITLTALSTDFNAARTAMAKFKDDRGKPFHRRISGLVVVCPPDLQTEFEKLLNSQLYPQAVETEVGVGAITNVMQGAANLVVLPDLTDTNDWYLLKTDRPVKPFIFQDRAPMEFGSLTQNSESGFMREVYYFGTRARYNVGYGLWQCAVKTVNA